MRIIYGKWIKRDGDLFLLVWDKFCQSHLIKPPFYPHFFIRRRQLDDARPILARHRDLIESIDEPEFITADTRESVARINVYLPSHVNPIRRDLEVRGIVTYESDIPFIRNVLIHWKYLEIESNPTRIWFDIEVDSRKGFSTPINPTQRIISISAVTQHGKEFFFSEESERDTILDFLKVAKKYALWIGWNSDKYDIPYLEARMRVLGINESRYPSQTLDLMHIFAREILFSEPETAKLDYWARKILGRGKTIEELHADTIWELFQNNRDELRRYNIGDCELTRDIDLTISATEYRINIAYLTKLFYEQTGRLVLEEKNGKLDFRPMGGKNIIIDNYILMKASEMEPRIVFPRKEKRRKQQKKGALIMKPVPGLHRDVLYLDLKSLYPSIVITFNIGYDTLTQCRGDVIRTMESCFVKKPRSIFALSLQELMAMRDRLKQEMKKYDKSSKEYGKLYARQYAVKVIMNSFIGVFGFEGSRFFRKEIFESVTKTARWVIETVAKIVSDMGIRVLYGDTDSVFIKKPTNMSIDEIIERINKELYMRTIEKFNVPPEYFSLLIKLDEEFEKIYFLAKKQTKRYFGWIKENRSPNILDPHELVIGGRLTKVAGIDIVRRNKFALLDKVQEKLIEFILSSDPDKFKEQVIQKIRTYLGRVKQYLYSGILDKLLIYSTGTKLDPREYKANQPHVIAIKKLQKMGRFIPGEVVRYVIVGYDSSGKLNAEPVIDGKIPPISRSGYDYYWERIQRMIENILGFRVSASSELGKFFM